MIVDHLDAPVIVNEAARAYALGRVKELSAELAVNKRLRRRLKRRYFAMQLAQAFCIFRLFALKRFQAALGPIARFVKLRHRPLPSREGATLDPLKSESSACEESQ
jgi:hypothetical protein